MAVSTMKPRQKCQVLGPGTHTSEQVSSLGPPQLAAVRPFSRLATALSVLMSFLPSLCSACSPRLHARHNGRERIAGGSGSSAEGSYLAV